MELLVPATEEGVLNPWLKSGTKLYHLAYVTADIQLSYQRLVQSGAKVVVQPVPAVAFGGRLICFVMMPNMLMVELVAKSHSHADV